MYIVKTLEYNIEDNNNINQKIVFPGWQWHFYIHKTSTRPSVNISHQYDCKCKILYFDISCSNFVSRLEV